MSANDIDPVLARIVNRVQSVTNIGPVYSADIWAQDDLSDVVVTTIGGTPKLRAWWVTGPALPEADRIIEIAPQYLHRWWEYTIHGIEGMPEDVAAGDGAETLMATLRANALAVTDALDASVTLNNTCHRAWPCTWPVRPELRFPIIGLVGYVEIRKRVLTLSTPS